MANGRDPRSTLTNVSSLESGPWQEDAYLKPVLDNDELLLHEWDEEEGAAAPHVEPDEDLASLMEEMKLLAAQDDSVRELLASSGDQANGASSSQPQPVAAAEQSKDAEAARIDDNYFESYSFFDIHREMLSDKVRTEAYRKALENNPSLMEGATVLDVGCGTGVLSMFAVRGGASRVVAVDGSREIASFAKEICAANGFGGGQEGPVVVVSSRVESLQQLPVDTPDGKVDVLVSEWMGESAFTTMLHFSWGVSCTWATAANSPEMYNCSPFTPPRLGHVQLQDMLCCLSPC